MNDVSLTGKVLAVDHPAVRRVAHAILEQRGYEVVEAAAEEPVRILQHERGIRLLITNSARLIAAAPEHVAVLCPSCAPAQELQTACRERGVPILTSHSPPSSCRRRLRNACGASGAFEQTTSLEPY